MCGLRKYRFVCSLRVWVEKCVCSLRVWVENLSVSVCVCV